LLDFVGIVKNQKQILSGLRHEIIQPLDFHRNTRAMACHGLTEQQIADGIPLSEALSSFEDFCGREKILAAWGAYWDIPYLRVQYDKINRKWPFHYRSFDLKSVAIWELAKQNKPLPGGVGRFLNILKLDFEGTPHNAIDDIKNSVKILKYLKTCKKIK